MQCVMCPNLLMNIKYFLFTQVYLVLDKVDLVGRQALLCINTWNKVYLKIWPEKSRAR